MATPDEAEADVFEVWRDVARHVRLDPDRVAISGYSMGGFGTYRLASAYPDLFGRAFTGVGPAGSGRAGLEQNVRWVPFMNWVAVADELITYNRARAAQDSMVAAGMPSQMWSFAGEHFTLAIQDEWGAAASFLGDSTVHRRPWHVSYAFAAQDAEPSLGLDRDGAYWVSGLQPRDPAVLGRIDARSLLTGERDAEPVAVSGARLGVGGFPLGARIGDGVPTPPVAVEGLAVGPASPSAPPERTIELDLKNVSTATLDLTGAGVHGRAPVLLRIVSDGPATVRAGRTTCAVQAGSTTCSARPKAAPAPRR